MVKSEFSGQAWFDYLLRIRMSFCLLRSLQIPTYWFFFFIKYIDDLKTLVQSKFVSRNWFWNNSLIKFRFCNFYAYNHSILYFTALLIAFVVYNIIYDMLRSKNQNITIFAIIIFD